MQRSARVLLAVGLLLFAGLAALSLSPLDPLAEFRGSDGTLSIPGGRLTPELQSLLFRSEFSYAEYTYAPVRSVYPTLAILGTESPFVSAPARSTERVSVRLPQFNLAPILDSLARLLSMDWLVGNAAAANRFLVLGDADCTVTQIATDGGCWASTSGGTDIAGVPGAADAAIADANSGAGTGTQDAAMTVGSLNTTGFAGTWDTGTFALTSNGAMTIRGTFDFNGSTVTANGNVDVIGATMNEGSSGSQSTFVFAATGTLIGNGYTNPDFYNMTINDGVTTTWDWQVGCSDPGAGNCGIWVMNALNLNGTLVAAAGAGQPHKIFMVSGEVDLSPLNRGINGDLDSSGYFVYRYRAACNSTYTMTAALYQHVAIQGGNSACAFTTNLGGNISTPSCGSYRDCAILFSSEATLTPAANFVVNTQNFSITSGGQFWIGDGGTTGATLNAGSSAITAYGVSPLGNVVVNWQTATITARPSTGEVNGNVCHTSDGAMVENLNSATFNCYGQFRLNSGVFNAGSGIVNVNDDGCGAADCGTDMPGSASPGEVVIFAGARINFGTSTWTVESLWQNGNTSAQTDWDAGTASVTFSHVGVNTDYNFGGSALGEAEFYNVTITSPNATPMALGMVTDSAWVLNTLTITDSVSTTTMNAGTLDLTFDRLVVSANGVLTMNGFSADDFEMDTSSGSIALTDWAAYTENPVDVRWTFDPSSAGSTVTATFTLVASNWYALRRDGSQADNELSDGSGAVTFSVTGGWSPHAMSIVASTASGGGGGGEVPECDPNTEDCPGEAAPVAEPPWLMAFAVVALVGGGLALFSRRGLRWLGIAILVVGVLGVLYFLGYL